jgi:hypothetical protein
MHSEVVQADLALDMANRGEVHANVSWFTIFADEMTQYPRKKVSRAG